MTDHYPLRVLVQALLRLDTLVVATVIAAAIAISLFVHQRMTQIRQALPAEVLEQQRDVVAIAHDLSDLVRTLDIERNNPRPQESGLILKELRQMLDKINGIRRNYTFDSLVGASAAHALVNPAAQDIERWLTSGVHDYPPHSRVVLDIAYQRARDTHSEMRELVVRSDDTALRLLGVEALRLERLRDGLVMYILAFSLFATVAVVLLIRKRNAETKVAIERKRLNDAIESIDQGLILFDTDERLIVCNRRFHDLYPRVAAKIDPGMSSAAVTRHLAEDGSIESVANQSDDLYEVFIAQDAKHGEAFEIMLHDGRYIRISEHRTREGGTVSVHSDITDMKLAQERLEHLATHDALTGLASRRHFEESLVHAINLAQRHDRKVAVMFLDVDRFKRINDTFGHVSGDRLLAAVAERLQRCLRKDDTVGRLGGDEFAAILEDVRGWKQVATSAERTIEALAAPIDVGHSEAQVTVSIGIALFPQDGTTMSNVLKNADDACYHAKSLGRNNYQFYTEEMNSQAAERLMMETNLRKAMENNELSIYYQPQMHLASGRIVGMEALLRWRNSDLGDVSPSKIIRVGEETGLIMEIGEWVLKQACQQSERWRERSLSKVCMWVNISSRQFRHTNFADMVRRVLGETGLESGGLGLEITETAIADDMEYTVKALKELHALGVQLSIDDFGMGYSSLASLKQFPLDALKIDCSFVRNIGHDTDDLEIVSAVIAMAHKLRLEVIAEGVETEEQLTLLIERESDQIQGHLLSEALPPTSAARFLKEDISEVLPLSLGGTHGFIGSGSATARVSPF